MALELVSKPKCYLYPLKSLKFQAYPLLIEHKLSLQSFDVSTPLLQTCALSSDDWICIQDNPEKVTIINLFARTKKSFPATCDRALIHPKGTLLALCLGQTIQVFDLIALRKIKMAELRTGNLSFWKWICEDVIAIVTKSHVYHWSISKENSELEVSMMTFFYTLIINLIFFSWFSL